MWSVCVFLVGGLIAKIVRTLGLHAVQSCSHDVPRMPLLLHFNESLKKKKIISCDIFTVSKEQ